MISDTGSPAASPPQCAGSSGSDDLNKTWQFSQSAGTADSPPGTVVELARPGPGQRTEAGSSTSRSPVDPSRQERCTIRGAICRSTPQHRRADMPDSLFRRRSRRKCGTLRTRLEEIISNLFTSANSAGVIENLAAIAHGVSVVQGFLDAAISRHIPAERDSKEISVSHGALTTHSSLV